MNKKIRDSLFYVFIILFIIGTVILSLYASGYKFNLSWPLELDRMLVKTGMLAVDSNPRSAIIYIDGKAETDKSFSIRKRSYISTPAKIKGLLPGDYELTIERPGYWPYQTTITIESGITTFQENISLFKADNPTIKSITEQNITEEELFLSNDNNYLFLKNSNKIVNLEKDAEQLGLDIILDKEKCASPYWTRNNELLVAGNLISIKNPNRNKNYNEIISSSAYNWKLNESDNKLYYLTENNLSVFDVGRNIAETISKEVDIIDYLPDNRNVYIITKENDEIYFMDYLMSEKTFQNKINLPFDGSYLFVNNASRHLSIYDSKNRDLYLIDKSNINKGARRISSVDDWAFISNNELIYIDKWELKHLNIERNTTQLLFRISSALENVLYNENRRYLVLSSQEELMIFDLRTNHLTTILRAEKILSPVIDKSNHYLYFWGKLENQQGVYRISIR